MFEIGDGSNPITLTNVEDHLFSWSSIRRFFDKVIFKHVINIRRSSDDLSNSTVGPWNDEGPTTTKGS